MYVSLLYYLGLHVLVAFFLRHVFYYDLQIFGATEEDVQKLKIVSIQEVDIDVLDSMIGAPDDV